MNESFHDLFYKLNLHWIKSACDHEWKELSRK